MRQSTTIEVGRLACREVRNLLDAEIFKGRAIRYHESSGWVMRTFTITGETADLTALLPLFSHLEAGDDAF